MFRVKGSGFSVQCSEFRVQGSGFRVHGSGFRVQGSWFRSRMVHTTFGRPGSKSRREMTLAKRSLGSVTSKGFAMCKRHQLLSPCFSLPNFSLPLSHTLLFLSLSPRTLTCTCTCMQSKHNANIQKKQMHTRVHTHTRTQSNATHVRLEISAINATAQN